MYKSYNDIIDIVNDNDEVVDQKTRGEAHEKGLQHREIHVWIFDKDKNIYFQKRAPSKSHAGLLDASVGGHVDQGEDYIDSAMREMYEETGIQPAKEDLSLVLKFNNISTNDRKEVNRFMRGVFVYNKPIDMTILKKDESENSGFEKFPLEFLENVSETDSKKFIQFVLTHEMGSAIKHIKTLT